MKNIKLANFDNPKWTYRDLCRYAQKYRSKLPEGSDIMSLLARYNSQPREDLINHLKRAQKFLYK